MNKPPKPPRRSGRAASLDDRIDEALERMLEHDEEITHRAVVRAVDGVSAASSLTRDSYRRSLVEYAQEVQGERRQWVKRVQKVSQAKTVAQLAAKDRRIEELECRVALLTASHKAMILAVGEMGGMTAWRRFFEFYDHARTALEEHLPPDLTK